MFAMEFIIQILFDQKVILQKRINPKLFKADGVLVRNMYFAIITEIRVREAIVQ